MPYRVNSCFECFNRDVVNLDSNQTPTARTSRDNLIGNMHSLSDRGLIPIAYPEKDMPFGSFARRTKIRPLDDIDIMICLSGCGGHWHYINSDDIAITMPTDAPVLSELLFEDGTLNSRKVIERIKNNLQGLNNYKKADIHRNKEAVTLQLKSYDWNFDIVPCFYAIDNFYIIPNGDGNWKKTDPRIDQNRVTNINQLRNGKVLQLIRTMKYWKSIWWSNVSSYMFEQMILNHCENVSLEVPFSQQIMNALQNLSQQILSPVYDPKNMQGDLNCFDTDTRQRLSQIASSSYEIAYNAWVNEFIYNEHKDAIAMWGKIFGGEFPEYGF